MGIYFYISNCRMKKRPIRDLMYTNQTQDHCIVIKHKLYERQGHRCHHCEQPFDYEQLEMHHILPLSRFPELGQSIRNGILLCHACHKEVHCNPWRNIELMKAKAEELGIDLNEKYSIRL
jgi:5-methylcytosine-specific restriction endonuclease McrA